MINEKWATWIFFSGAKHFSSKLDTNFMVEGEANDTKDVDERIEYRMDGPRVNEISRNYYTLYVEINLLISVKKKIDDIANLHNLTGKALAAFTSIDVCKLGTNDDKSLVGCMGLVSDFYERQRLQVYHLGQREPHSRFLQTVIEGHYLLRLKGE
jgi:hypothetical protein